MREQYVYRRWERARRLYFQRYLQRVSAAGLADDATIYALFLSFVALPIDLTMMGFEWDLWDLRRIGTLPGTPFALAFVALTLANAVRAERAIVRWGSRGAEAGWLLRVTRMLLFALPFASFWTLSLWNRAIERWPHLGRSRGRSAEWLSVDGGGQALPRSVPAPVDGALFGGPGRAAWFLLELLVTGGSVCWLVGQRPPHTLVLLVCSASVHLVIAGVAWVGGHERVRISRLSGARRRLRLWLSVLCLAPLPIGSAPLILDFVRSISSGLVWSAHAGLGEPDRTAGWRELRRLLGRRYESGSWWARWREPSGGSRAPASLVAERRLRELIQAKAVLTLADGLIVGWASVAFGGLGKNPEGAISWGDPLLVVPLGWVLFGIALSVATFGGMLLRVPGCRALLRRPYALALALPGWMLALGVLVGQLAAGGVVAAQVSILLAMGSVIPVMAAGAALIVSPVVSSDPPDLRQFLWALLPAIWVPAALLYARPEPPLRELATAAVLLAPAVHLGLGLTLGRWLLWPYRLADLGDRGAPGRRRLLLAVLATTAMLPLGGLAAPLWVAIRHRLGPDLSRRLDVGAV